MNFSLVTHKEVLLVNLELERERLSRETIPEMKRAIELHIRSLENRLAFDLDKYFELLN